MLLVQLRPEEGQQGVSTVEAPGGGEGQIGEQGDSLGRRQNRAKLLSVGIAQIEPSQGPKFNHAAILLRIVPSVTADVTAM